MPAPLPWPCSGELDVYGVHKQRAAGDHSRALVSAGILIACLLDSLILNFID